MSNWLNTGLGHQLLAHLKRIGAELGRYNDGQQTVIEDLRHKVEFYREEAEKRRNRDQWGPDVHMVESVPYEKVMCPECKSFFLLNIFGLQAAGRRGARCPFCSHSCEGNLTYKRDKEDAGE